MSTAVDGIPAVIDAWTSRVMRRELDGMRFGRLTLTVHEGVVVGVTTEKHRRLKRGGAGEDFEGKLGG